MLADSAGTTWFAQEVIPYVYDAEDETAAFALADGEERKLSESYLPDKARAALRATALKTRNTTYGEVVPASIWEHILPRLELTETDVFYDIGSGTGKIPLQVALQSLAVAKGVEFVAARHATGVKALNKLRKWAESEDVELGSAKVKAEVTSALSRVQLIQGDACVEPLDDATAIFINNTVFQPDLMATILERLAKLPNLRVLVTLRRICSRHRDTACGRKNAPCCAFQHPKEASGVVWPTWDSETTMFVYYRTPRITDFFTRAAKGAASGKARKSRMASAM